MVWLFESSTMSGVAKHEPQCSSVSRWGYIDIYGLYLLLFLIVWRPSPQVDLCHQPSGAKLVVYFPGRLQKKGVLTELHNRTDCVDVNSLNELLPSVEADAIQRKLWSLSVEKSHRMLYASPSRFFPPRLSLSISLSLPLLPSPPL